MAHSKAKRYWGLTDRRAEELRKLSEHELIQKILGLEALALHFMDDDPDSTTPYPLYEELKEFGEDALDSLLYNETRLWVAHRVDRDFQPEDDRSRRDLIEVVTQMILEHKENPDSV